MNIEKTKILLNENLNCAQVITSYFSEKLNIDKDSLINMASAFGGGMGYGETCGAVTGALMVIGLKYGNNKEILKEYISKYNKEFSQIYSSTQCKDLLGYNITTEKEKIIQENLFENFCPCVVTDSINILEKMI